MLELNVPKRCASRSVREIQELLQAYDKLIKNKLFRNNYSCINNSHFIICLKLGFFVDQKILPFFKNSSVYDFSANRIKSPSPKVIRLSGANCIGNFLILVILTVVSLCTAAGAWLWLMDPGTSRVGLSTFYVSYLKRSCQ